MTLSTGNEATAVSCWPSRQEEGCIYGYPDSSDSQGTVAITCFCNKDLCNGEFIQLSTMSP